MSGLLGLGRDDVGQAVGTQHAALVFLHDDPGAGRVDEVVSFGVPDEVVTEEEDGADALVPGLEGDGLVADGHAVEAHVHPGEDPDGVGGGHGDGVVEVQFLGADGGDFLCDIHEGDGPEKVADVGHIGRDGEFLDGHLNVYFLQR